MHFILPFALAATTEIPRLQAMRVHEPPVVDGRLDDPAWDKAPSTDRFTQKFPSEAAAPSERTRVRIVYDDEAVYVGFDCEQHRTARVRRLTRRDRQVDSDRVTVTFDTRRDGTSGFEFSLSASGVQVDAIRYDDTGYSSDWDENWEGRVAETDTGWSAEMRIPLRILRFESIPHQSWGLQLRRYIAMRQETDEWAFIARNRAGEVSHYGKLDDLRELRFTSRVELRPFVLGRLRARDPDPDRLASGTDFRASAGIDLRWHAAPTLTLDASVLPDFAQVEADQVVLNLTTYETFYPEKRTFFLEGIETFRTPYQLLYTRRIGRVPATPSLRTAPPYSERVVDSPEPATIYAAEKLVGRLGKRWHLGVLAAVTAPNRVDVELRGGTRAARLADPLTFFQVTRVKYDIGDNAHIGAIATATTRAERSVDYPRSGDPGDTLDKHLCPSGDRVSIASRCFHNAYVAGVDWRWRSPGGTYAASGQVVASLIDKGPQRTLSDGTVLRSGDIGPAAQLYFGKEGGEHWLWWASYNGLSRKVDYNDLGFMSRQNAHYAAARIGYRTLRPWAVTLETNTGIDTFYSVNLGGLDLGKGVSLNNFSKYRNFWWSWLELQLRAPRFEDREVGDGTALERAGFVGLQLDAGSDARRAVAVWGSVSNQLLSDGVYFRFAGELTLQPFSQLELKIAPEITYAQGEPRYVGASGRPGEYLFGRLLASSVGTTVRATYTFAPRLSLQMYAQLFTAAGHYTDFASVQTDVTAGRPVIRLRDLASAPRPAQNPDFESGALNVNLVLRWEYRLGSTLYAVYTRSQVPSVQLLDNQAATLNFDSVRRAPAADIVIVKLSYWWG